MSIIIGSARSDSRGKYSGDAAGDQKQTSSTNDTKGEVSMQPFYLHSKGWYVIRAKEVYHAMHIARNMMNACNNQNIGYDQGNRLAIIKDGTRSKVLTECDCSSLVRQCIIEATGIDPGNFTTLNEKTALLNTGIFYLVGTYNKNTVLKLGDILVTQTKGHTVIVVSAGDVLYPECKKDTTSLVEALKSIGVDSSFSNRKKIALANGFIEYKGTAEQNIILLNRLKSGKLIQP